MKSMDWRWWAPILATISAAVITGLFGLLQKKMPGSLPPLLCEIQRPLADQTVARELDVFVKLDNVPPQKHLWIAVEYNDRLWVKKNINAADRSAVVTISENGEPPEGIFSLSLILVASKGHRFIEKWLRNGVKTGSFPGLAIDEIPGASRIAVVPNLKLPPTLQTPEDVRARAPRTKL